MRKSIFLRTVSVFLSASQLLLAVKPAAPSNPNFYPLSATSISLNWIDNATHEQGFKIYRDGELIHVTTQNQTTYIDRGLQPNTSYFYEVNATDIAPFKLQEPEGDKIYFGAEPGFVSEDNIGDTNQARQTIKSFDDKAVKPAMWTYFSNNWAWDGGISYPEDEIDSVLSMGKIPFVRLMPIKGDGVDPMGDDATFDANKTYTLAAIGKGNYDRKIKDWAEQAKEHFIRAKNANKPFYLVLDFAPEMNGYWFQWGGTHQDASEYVVAYRHIIDIFRKEKVPHVTWVFHPDLPLMSWYTGSKFATTASTSSWKNKSYTLWADPSLYYPGDDYIDWIGFSIYGRDEPLTIDDDDYPSFASKMVDNFNYIKQVSQTKPILVAEFATMKHPTDDMAKATWIEEAFNYILSEPRIRAITYWNESWEKDNILINMDINSSQNALNAFRSSIGNSRFINEPNGSFQ